MNPADIWERSVAEGARRVSRSTSALVATGVVGGVDVMLGVTALTVVSGAVATVAPGELAHVLGAAVFGIGFVFILLGRSELFTENFLMPIAAASRRRASASAVARLWAVTLVGNLLGLLLLAAILSRAGLVPPGALDAAGGLADTFAGRSLGVALLSAVVGGTTMTLMTWLAAAVDDAVARIIVALLVGFLLAAPSLNHAVVGFGEMSFGVLAGTAQHATWVDVAQNLPVAIVGNFVGGLFFVTLARAVQAHGEPRAQQ
ncbi:MAG TPA: formate/nitrite transporter family protein [Capillimicrobium sp.]